MALIKDEWVISKQSTIEIGKAFNYIQGKLNTKQEDDSNKGNSDDYINNYFADLFDARNGAYYKIYSEGATTGVLKGDVSAGDSFYNVVLTSDIIEKIKNEGSFLTNVDASTTYATKAELPDLTNYRVEDEIVQIVNGKIASIQIDEVIIG